MKTSDKLAKAMLKHGTGLLAQKRKLENLGFDPEAITKKIAKIALSKFETLKEKAGGGTATKTKPDKKAKKSKSAEPEEVPSKKPKKKAKKSVDDKADKANPDKKTGKDKKAKGDKKKARKEVNREVHGQRYTLLGHSAGSVIVTLGVKGVSLDETRLVVKKFATPKPGPADTTIKLRHYDGTSGKFIHGQPAELTKSDWKEIKGYIAKKAAK